jgi:hypothetical protein
MYRKEEDKAGASATHKQKSDQEESTLGLSNRAMKGDSTGFRTSSSSNSHRVPIPVQEDGMAIYFTALAKAKTDESKLHSDKFAEEKRQNVVAEDIAERSLALEVDQLAFQLKKYEAKNDTYVSFFPRICFLLHIFSILKYIKFDSPSKLFRSRNI